MADKQAGATAPANSAAAGETGKPAATAAASTTGAETKTAEQLAAEKTAADTAAATAAAAAATGAEPKSKDAPATPAAKAPEKYDLKVPDAATALLEDADLKMFEKVARDNDMSQEDAQAFLEEQVATLTAQSERFLAETKADKTYGGDKLTETTQLAQSIVDKVRPVGHARRDSFLRFMGRGGAGNHIEVLSFLADLGRAMGEDVPGHTRSSAVGSGKSAAELLYDNPSSKASGT